MASRIENDQEPATLRHCALCAIPCLPISDVPPALVEINDLSPLRQVQEEHDWLKEYTTLRMSTGSESYPTWAGSPAYPPIQVHKYCLAAGLQLQGSAHGWRMLQAWSLPKWTGGTRWAEPSRDVLGVTEMMAGLAMSHPTSIQEGVDTETGRRIDDTRWKIKGSMDWRGWKGLKAQQMRWRAGERHCVELDLVSPLNIPPPKPGPTSFDLSIRPRELNSLATLTPHILAQIASYLLDDAPESFSPSVRLNQPPRPPPNQAQAPHRDLHALLNTSSTLRYYDFPHTFWARLIGESVDEYKRQLLNRWTVSPGQAISPDRLEKALAEDFGDPVEVALGATIAPNGDKVEYTARDIYYWWTFSEAWRSKRRVWRCVVYGCAQARDADWL